MKALGIILIVAGVLFMVFTGISFTQDKKVLDLGRVEVTKEERTPVNWSPIVGAALLVAGVVVLLVPKRTA